MVTVRSNDKRSLEHLPTATPVTPMSAPCAMDTVMHMKTVKLTWLYQVLSSGIQIEATIIESFIHLTKSIKQIKCAMKAGE